MTCLRGGGRERLSLPQTMPFMATCACISPLIFCHHLPCDTVGEGEPATYIPFSSLFSQITQNIYVSLYGRRLYSSACPHGIEEWRRYVISCTLRRGVWHASPQHLCDVICCLERRDTVACRRTCSQWRTSGYYMARVDGTVFSANGFVKQWLLRRGLTSLLWEGSYGVSLGRSSDACVCSFPFLLFSLGTYYFSGYEMEDYRA
jgi:hypothetical protein